MRNEVRSEAVLQLLKTLEGIEPLKQLFWTELNYERIYQPISRRQWTDSQQSLLAEDPVLFAGAGDEQGFQIIYSRLASDRLLLSPERTVVSRLQAEYPYALFIFSNRNQDRWHFVNVKQEAQDTTRRRESGRKALQRFRRITIGPEERLRTAAERIAMLDVQRAQRGLFGVSPLDIQKLHDEAFDVEAVTKQFFEGYKALFGIIQNDLARQTKDAVWAHDYALQFLNRMMFLYFVQRKRWLGEDTEFLRAFWEAYQDSGQTKDTFLKSGFQCSSLKPSTTTSTVDIATFRRTFSRPSRWLHTSTAACLSPTALTLIHPRHSSSPMPGSNKPLTFWKSTTSPSLRTVRSIRRWPLTPR